MTANVVSIIVPALNEAEDIEGCLEAIAREQWPREYLEVVLVDAASEDATVEKAAKVANEFGLDLKVCENPARRTSVGLNIGLAACRGDVVVRVDARSRIGPSHVSHAVKTLGARRDVGVVGGGQRARARSESVRDRGIARALGNRYTTGLARYRRATRSGSADTVWMGAFRTDDLRTLGGWNEAVALNEDYDLNRRVRDAGLLVWFDPAMDAEYVPRPDLRRLALQYFRFGRVKGTWWARGRRPAPRQLLLVLAPLAAVGTTAITAIKIGPLVTVAAALGALCALDALGCDGAAPPVERAVALTAATVSCASWWTGVVIGLAGETLGVRHAHG
ncbi:MAG: glycosyltransferase [Acidimicrobiales bacterium]